MGVGSKRKLGCMSLSRELRVTSTRTKCRQDGCLQEEAVPGGEMTESGKGEHSGQQGQGLCSS